MVRGSSSRCRRAFLTILAVAVCVVASVSATAQTATHFASGISSESVTTVWGCARAWPVQKHGLNM
jgi:hypothetical protein